MVDSFGAGGEVHAQTEDLDTVLNRWADAVGGVDRLAAVDVLYVRRAAKMAGLDGVIEEWAAADGRYRMAIDLGDGLFTQTDVLDGTTGWRVDRNGKVVELTGEDLASQHTTAYLSTFNHLVPARRQAASIELVSPEDARAASTGTATDPDGVYHYIRITPPDGVPTLYVLDAATGLPVRSERPNEDQTVVSTFDEWKVFEGIRLSVDDHQSSGDARFDQAFHITEVRFDPDLPDGLFERPKDTADDLRFLSGDRATDIPFELYGEHVRLTAEVQGQPAAFLFDTGAGATVMNTSKAEAMGLPMEGKLEARGAGEQSLDAHLIKDVSFGLPGVAIDGQTVVAISLDPLQAPFGCPMDGILGYDLISRCVVTLDYANERMHLHDPRTFEYTGDGVVLPLHIEDAQPHITLEVTPYGRDPITCNIMIDTGASASVGFTKPFTAEHDLLSSLPESIYFRGGFGVGGEMSSYQGRVAKVAIGPYELDNVLVGFSDDDGGAGADPTNAGLIGGEILKRFTVTFDYAHQQVIFEANARLHDPFEQEMCGLNVISGGAGAWRTYSVHRVLPDSPASEAGIQEGDVLVTIDGRPSADFSLPELSDYLHREGQEVQFTLRRGDEEIETTITLRRLI